MRQEVPSSNLGVVSLIWETRALESTPALRSKCVESHGKRNPSKKKDAEEE